MSKRYNKLSGKEWLQYSFSIWRDLKKSQEERNLSHPAMFPLALVDRVIDIFSIEKDTVLDPFSGIGTTMLASYLKKRKAISIELSFDYYEIQKKRLDRIKNQSKSFFDPVLINVDSRKLLNYVGSDSVDLCLTSPPYWDILNMKRSADKKKGRNYSDLQTDLGNISNYSLFINEIISVFSSVYSALKIGGHCVIALMDIRKKDKFYPFHSDLAARMQDIGFVFEDIIIWDRQHEYNNMKPLGYPYVFRINKVHEYILIFRKRGEK